MSLQSDPPSLPGGGGTGCLGAALIYIPVTLLLSVPFLMGECIPRDAPNVAICDAQKRADLLVYTGLFLLNPFVASLLVRWKTWRAGSLYLLAASLMPFLVVLAMNLSRAPWY